jgi:hypothetical protein
LPGETAVVLPTCPRCSAEFVKRIVRKGFKERLLRGLSFHLFRCQICRHRFRVFKWRAGYPEVAEERREYDRLAMNCPLTFSGEASGGSGTVSDISVNGCAFLTRTALAEKTVLRLSLHISAELPPIRVDAAVVRHVRSGRVGVEFLRLQPGEHHRLQLFIRGLRRG